jgi:hypothetical protein
MLAAAVVATWFAQAEPAPPEPAPKSAAAPLVVPAPAATPLPVSDNALAVYAGWSRRLGSEAETVGPANGVSVGGQYHRRYLTLAGGLELGAALDFFYGKFAQDVTGSMMVAPGQEETFPSQRVISETSFALLQSVAWRHNRLRPFAEVGLGFTIAYFSTPELVFRPGSFNSVQPLGRGLAGFEVAVTHDIAISIRAAYSLTFTRPTYTPGTISYSFLGNFFDADLGASFQF